MTQGSVRDGFDRVAEIFEHQIATARAYAEAYPKSGRPYPAKTVRRALKGAGLEALDEVLDQEE